MTYELLNIYHNSTSDIRNEIVDLWIRNHASSKLDALDRANYAVCAIRCLSTNKIIGVSAAKINLLPRTSDIYYFFGFFIDKDHRGKTIPHKQPWITQTTFDILKNENNPYIKGLAAVIENPKITDKSLKKYGWNKLDHDIVSKRIFFKNF